MLLERVFHNKPYVSGATTPAEVAEKLDKAGVKYSLQPIKEGEGGMFRLDVPSTEWSMLLVKKKFCHEFIEL